MNCNFTLLRIDIIPNGILCGMWNIFKEHIFPSFVLEPFYINTWSVDRNSAAKSTKILEVVLLFCRQMNRRRPLSNTRRSIADTQDMKESKRSVGNKEDSTNQTTFDTIQDSMVRMFDRTILG